MINKGPRLPMNALALLAGLPRFDIDKLREDAKYAGLDNPEHRPYCGCHTMARMKPVGNEWLCDANETDYAGRYGCGARIERKGAGHEG